MVGIAGLLIWWLSLLGIGFAFGFVTRGVMRRHGLMGLCLSAGAGIFLLVVLQTLAGWLILASIFHGPSGWSGPQPGDWLGLGKTILLGAVPLAASSAFLMYSRGKALTRWSEGLLSFACYVIGVAITFAAGSALGSSWF